MLSCWFNVGTCFDSIDIDIIMYWYLTGTRHIQLLSLPPFSDNHFLSSVFLLYLQVLQPLLMEFLSRTELKQIKDIVLQLHHLKDQNKVEF